MYQWIYTRPLWQVYYTAAALFFLWTLFSAFVRHQDTAAKKWQHLNGFVLIFAFLGITYGTLLAREEGQRQIIWQLGHMYRTWGASSEALRLLVMNALLFFPFGLALPCVLSRRLPPLIRIILTMVSAFLLSSLLEQLQYHYALGVTELDDIVCNTAGAFLASLHTLAFGRQR